MPAGSYTITVKTFDNEDGEGSSSVSITVTGSESGSCTAPAWVSGQGYTGGQIVSYQGHEYKAKWWTQQTPGGSEWEDHGPCDGSGNPPTGSCTAPVWVSGQAYNGGDVVSLDGREYKAKWWTNQNPVGSSDWEDLGACDGGGNPPNGAPQVSLTSPSGGQSFVQGTTISINANASDTDGSIAKVEFNVDGSMIGQDTSAPYTINWTASLGNHTITAKATDNDNKSTTSTAVTVTVTSDGGSGCQGDGFKVVGYSPSWQGDANNIQYDKLTHINYAFAIPRGDGSLEPLANAGKLRQIVSLGHAQGVKVLIAVGGWELGDGSGVDTRFVQLASNASARTAFVNNMISFVNEYNLDGVDMDWEYSDNGSEPQNYELLMRELAQALHSRGKLLTAAVVAQGWAGNGILSGVFNDVDFLNLMAYDGGDGASHSPYSYAESSLNYCLGRGLPKSKAVLGVPFYGRPSWKSYATLIAEGADPNSDVHQGVHYNGIPTIKAKTELAQQRGGGIMMWELSHDTSSQVTSLLTAINQVAGSSCGPENVVPQVAVISPADRATFTAGNTVNISANASDSDGNVTKVAFYIDGNLISEDTVSPYLANWIATSGNHTITARATDNAGAVRTSTLVSISVNGDTTNQPPTVSITGPGNDASFTTGQNVAITANANDTDGSISKVVFYVDGNMISEDTSAPYSTNWTSTVGSHSVTAIATDDDNANTTSAVINITVQNDTGGSGCDAQQNVDGSPYNTGDKVQNFGKEYECIVGGWCTVGGPYAPGDPNGWAWPDAWKELGDCSGGNPPGGNEAPTVSITQPVNGQSFTVGSSITIHASASDSDGNVTKVEFYRNGTKIGEDTNSPYSFTWNNASSGSYSLIAKAIDDDNAIGESITVNISVGSTNPPNPGGDLPKRLLVGYWHNFINPAGPMKLSEVSDKWDVVNIAFAVPTVPVGSTMTFTPDPAIYSRV
ncbi:Ig-like domain-containing protein [Aquimarina intermedia]|uniref:chitinase n=1 Tax=Aquimarina intermedia TaxID=350814 RepID=A0A5S5C949_9FLAO|nr:Ig-like domain-containing protein [Aquimarina intermedia]TYP75827.1 GH18 family chitinase [Aquimarina intermedia]